MTKYVCEFCGKEFYHAGRNSRRFCGKTCAGRAILRSNGGSGHKKGKYTMVKIVVTQDLCLRPGMNPIVGNTYDAERYTTQYSRTGVGYVITVNGHRINVRTDECVEV